MFFFKKKHFRNLSLPEIKDRARVLFIDDNDISGVIGYLANSGWKCRQLYEENFTSLDSVDIKDSHIICVDINGVGEKLGKQNGLDIVESIKRHNPNKKVIIYSSQTTQNIFHPAVEMADKRVMKSAGDHEVFKDSIEELAKQIFSWDEMIASSYEQVKGCFSENISLDRYKKLIEKTASSKDFSAEKLASVLKIAAEYMGVAVSIYEKTRGFL